MSGKQGLQPHCLLMRLFVWMNRGRHTQCGHLALFLWLEKQQVESVVKNLFLSVFTVITFHSKVLCIHMEAGTWVYVCIVWSTPHFHIFKYSLSSIFAQTYVPQKIQFTIVSHKHTHLLLHIHTPVVRWPPMTHKTWKSTNQPWRIQCAPGCHPTTVSCSN